MSIRNISSKKYFNFCNYLLAVVFVAFLSVSCSDNPSGSNDSNPDPEPDPNPEATLGSLEVTTITSGLDPNPKGYTVDIVDVENFQIDANQTITSEEIEEGSYSVELTDIEDHCTIQSENPVTVEVVAEETSPIEFEVECRGIFRNKIVFFRTQSQGAKTANSMVTQSYYTMNPDGSDKEKASDIAEEGNVHFLSDISPDGTKIVIAFSENRNGSRSNFRIAVVNAYDTTVNYLIEESDDTHYYHPVFSPDGTQIAFTGYSDSGLFGDIYVMNADGSNVIKVTNTDELEVHPSWSPDGTRLIFQRSSNDYKHLGIFSINTDGSGERMISNSEYNFQNPKWSPDGSKIIVSGSKDHQANYTSVYVMNADGSDIKKIVSKEEDGVFHSSPRWSPDGSYIIFSSNRAGEPDVQFGYSYEPYDLFRTNPDGSDLMNLTSTSNISESNMMWSPIIN